MNALGRVVRPLRVWVRDLVLNGFVASKVVPRGLRWRLLRICGLDVGRSSINAGCFFGGRGVSLGEGTFVNHEVFFDNAAPVVVGRNVSFGPRVSIITGTHAIGRETRRAGAYEAAPVHIGDGCWIGAGATILPGTRVGPGAIVAAGAVVADDVQADTLVAGVPARVLRRLAPLGHPDAGSGRGAGDEVWPGD